MTTDVDPFIEDFPEQWTTPKGKLTREAIHYLEYGDRWRHDMWLRSGGGDDSTSEQGVKEVYPWKAPKQTDSFEVNELLAGDTTYTTRGDEIVVCNNTSPAIVTLNPSADHKEQAIIIRNNAPVSITAVKKINGKTTKKILRRFTSPHHIFTTEADSWNVI